MNAIDLIGARSVIDLREAVGWRGDTEPPVVVILPDGTLGSMPELPTEAHARRSDPATSRVAAESIKDLTARQRSVLRAAATYDGPFTYDELIVWHQFQVETLPAWNFIPQEPQSIRSRAAELRRGGWITEAGEGRSATGRRCKTWRLTSRDERNIP